jgi:hypothetical protein
LFKNRILAVIYILAVNGMTVKSQDGYSGYFMSPFHTTISCRRQNILAEKSHLKSQQKLQEGVSVNGSKG